MFWSKKKPKEIPVTVYVNFVNGLRTKMELPNYAGVLKAMLGAAEDRYGEWLRTDDIYDPDVKFEITGLKYNADGRVIQLEFREKESDRLNE